MIRIKATIVFDATPNSVYPNGRWNVDYDVVVLGRNLGGECYSCDTLAQARLGLEESIRRTSDILPNQRHGALRVVKWISWIKARLSL